MQPAGRDLSIACQEAWYEVVEVFQSAKLDGALLNFCWQEPNIILFMLPFGDNLWDWAIPREMPQLGGSWLGPTKVDLSAGVHGQRCSVEVYSMTILQALNRQTWSFQQRPRSCCTACHWFEECGSFFFCQTDQTHLLGSLGPDCLVSTPADLLQFLSDLVEVGVPTWDNTPGAASLTWDRVGITTTICLPATLVLMQTLYMVCLSLSKSPLKSPIKSQVVSIRAVMQPVGCRLTPEHRVALPPLQNFSLLLLNSIGQLSVDPDPKFLKVPLVRSSTSYAKWRWKLSLLIYYLQMGWKCPLCHRLGDWWKYRTISAPVSFSGVLCSSLAARWPITTLITVLWPNDPANFQSI